MKSSTQEIVREMAKIYRVKTSDTRLFDANLCSWRIEPDRPWELIATSGMPLTKKTTFKYSSYRLRLMANSQYLALFVDANLTLELLSINRPDRMFELFKGKLSVAETIVLNHRRHPVFTLDGRVSEGQKAFLDLTGFHDFLEHIDLAEDESLHVSNEMVLYVHSRTVPSLERTIELGVGLLMTAPKEQKLNEFAQMPAQFRALMPLVEKWAVNDDDSRSELIECSSSVELANLIGTVDPFMDSINAYLDSFGEQPLDSSAIALGRLAEAAEEAKRFLEG
jgi:hypothetical protein